MLEEATTADRLMRLSVLLYDSIKDSEKKKILYCDQALGHM
jgi:hypothetical protein